MKSPNPPNPLKLGVTAKHYPGKGCMCAAQSSADCGCTNVDWRSAREIELEELLKNVPKTRDGVYVLNKDMELWHKEHYYQKPLRILYPEEGAPFVCVVLAVGRDNFVSKSEYRSVTECYSNSERMQKDPD